MGIALQVGFLSKVKEKVTHLQVKKMEDPSLDKVWWLDQLLKVEVIFITKMILLSKEVSINNKIYKSLKMVIENKSNKR